MQSGSVTLRASTITFSYQDGKRDDHDENLEKSIAAVLAGLMGFGVWGTSLALPAEAASHQAYEQVNAHPAWHQAAHERELAKQKKSDHERWEREHRRAEKSSKGHSTGEVTTAAILGAVVGAVIAKNT